ncbi:hypothetical protein DPSP01_003298 [Paraphaeosphaeria sporulosa]
MDAYAISRSDVFDVRALLAAKRLPNELVLAILDHARYWVEVRHEKAVLDALVHDEHSLEFSAAYPYMVIPTTTSTHGPSSEVSKLREIEIILVSHDQGWSTTGTRHTYQQSSSFWEASILRPIAKDDVNHVPRLMTKFEEDRSRNGNYRSVESAAQAMFPRELYHLLRRPDQDMEPQRLHCREMIDLTMDEKDPNDKYLEATQEGEHAWFLQCNVVARGVSLFHGEMVPRHHIIWSCKNHPRWVGNDGSGQGEGFVDAVKPGDCIVLWTRIKRQFWENHAYGVHVKHRYTI